ncbi:MAG: M57 family metalloprotease [Bacteroidia bacterium]|nr:M57 family metalloprotease [Bacteroidia bacterium]
MTDKSLDQYIPVLKKLGFNTKLVEDYGTSILVEGDISFSKHYLDSLSKSPVFNSQNKQALWSSAYLTWAAVSNINVYSNSSIPSDWDLALQDAVAHWTNLTGAVITMNKTSSSGNILVTSDFGLLANNVIASAGFPPNPSTPYAQININLDFNSGAYIPHAQKVYNLVHELGHCIGYRHTNYAALGESSGWEILHGIPTTDAGSVMNGSTANNQWVGFSYFDGLSAELVYPQWADFTQKGPAVWPNTYPMTSLNGFAYAVQYTKLYRINPSDGTYSQVGAGNWTGTEAICTLNGYLYLVENSRLYRVDANTGSYVQIGGAVWPGTEGMCTLNGYLYIVENSRLYRVDSNTGIYVQLGGAVWPGTKGMCALNGSIHLVQNNRLYKIDPNTGSYVQLGGAVWAGISGMCANVTNNMLFIVQNDLYYKVSPTTGAYTRLGGIAWAGTNSMTSIAGYNYIIENSRFYRVGIN